MSEPTNIRILLAHAHSLFRDALSAVMRGQPDLQVVAEVGEGAHAVAEAERTRPDVALIDCNLPNCDGLETTRLLRERLPDCRILFLAEEEDQKMLAEAVRAGANGFVTRDAAVGDLIEGTRAVFRGETLIPPRMLGDLLTQLIQFHHEMDEALRRMARLTRREREVLSLLAEGADNDTIAQALVISPQTARTHIQNLLSKLGVHSRLEAAAFVIRSGIHHDLVTVE